MLSNCDHEKMVLISSTTNEWPQMQQQDNIQIDDHHQKGLNNNMSSSTSSPATRIMEKPGQEQLQLQQQALKCPRCDSSNTKFCYYNNYSLSQPRHFCKACKRYWTRGGTLRNVPVGGGCRKNKRVKRPGSSSSSAMDGASSSSSSIPSNTANNNNSNSNPPSQPSQIDQINPMFYGLPSNPFMDSPSSASGFDLHQLNHHHAQLGLGFSSAGTFMSGDNYRNRFNPTSNSSLPSSNYSSIFSTSPSTTTTTPTMASVLASKFLNGGSFKDIQARGPNHNQYFQSLLPFEDLHIAAGNTGEAGGAAKDVKVEDQAGQNRLEWNNNSNNNNVNGNMNCQNQMTEQMGLSDPSLYWSSTTLGANWHDPSNLGSSVSSLI
ncbi:hypothetical protein PRUPE_4G050300 [Prunus persica]|uniref:Dof zinc finger protein n=1 Tax=Prunus persica TaxID=3760 RepID=M5X0R0_PRUPE|nr:dof zinc finger protein DOF1.4 [Prunus persica]ONI10484.1 hypothetical protein PRUPE_4G050300 [Prunus persica]